MKKILVVVDMQNDFVDGALGTKEAVAIVDNVVRKINSFTGDIFVTLDTHYENYMQTSEGKNLPVPHCIKGSDGWKLNPKVYAALENKAYRVVEKNTFGSLELAQIIAEKSEDKELEIELVGLCTDICVVSNALILKAAFPEAEISVCGDCCAGVSEESHKAALGTMSMCQIKIV